MALLAGRTTNANLAATAPATALAPPAVPPAPVIAPGNTVTQMLSNLAQQQPRTEVQINGVTYVVNQHVTYNVKQGDSQATSSLIDGGANGGLAGDDMRLLSSSLIDPATVLGIGDSEINNLPISHLGGVLNTTKGPVVGLFYQYAHHGKGASIHSVTQLQQFGLDVNEKPKDAPNGRQTIITPEGCVIPLSIRNGLAYMDMHPPSDEEMAILPHVIMTSDAT